MAKGELTYADAVGQIDDLKQQYRDHVKGTGSFQAVTLG
jgi:hypothetical protein